MSTYIHFTEEQKQRAASVDLEEFLRCRGEKLLASGREKRLARDHSVTIRGNEWYDHAEERGGHAVSFVQRFYHLSYPEAVTMLLGGELGTVYPSAEERVEEPPKPFVLPPANSNMRRVYAYLVKHRNIDRSVVAHFAREKLLYEDADYHNAVFVDIARSDPNNLAARAKAEKYAKILSKTIVNPDGDDSNRGQNAFFYDAAEGLLTSVILMLAEFLPPDKDHPQERRHIVSVFKLVQDLLEPSRVKGKSHFQLLMAKLPPDHKARWFAGAALNSAEQAMASVMSTVLSRLNAFLDSELEQILCFDSAIDAEKFASEKSAIFLILPEEDTTKNFMAGLMIQNLSRELFAVADENGGKLKNRVVLFCDEFGTMPPFDILPLFSAGRSRRLTLVPIIQSLAQLEKNYGKEGCEIIQDNCQDTIFGGFAPNSQTAEVLSKALGSRTVLSGSVSRGKNDPSQSLQMMERALLTPDELKSIPKGSFIVMKTGTHPMRTRLQLFLNWGITFGEPYVVPERANRAVAYANRVDLERNLPQLSEPEEMDESRGYAVSSRGGIAHAPAQERAVKRGKQMKTFGEEER